jgi:hypothetical protein
MGSAEVLSWVAVAVSVIALLVSGVLTHRQATLARHSNDMRALVDLMQEFRGAAFYDAEFRVLNDVANEIGPEGDYQHLSKKSRAAVNTVMSFFTCLGALVHQGIMQERTLVPIYGFRAAQAWEVLEPYVKQERVRRGDDMLGKPFEDFVCRARRNRPTHIAYKLHYESAGSA